MREHRGRMGVYAFVVLTVVLESCGGGGTNNAQKSANTTVAGGVTAVTAKSATTVAPKAGSNANTSKGGSDCAQANLALGYVASNFQNRTIDDGDVHTFAIAGRDALRALQSKVTAADDRTKQLYVEAFRTAADTYNDFATQTVGVTYNPATGAAPPAAFATAVQVFQRPAFQQAAITIAAVLGQLCPS